MQIRNVRYNIPLWKGCLKMIESLRSFDSSERAKKKLEIIEVYEKYGEEATKKIYKADRKVISRWKKRFEESGRKLESLVPYSTRPNRLRKSKTENRIVEKIRELRQNHYKLSKYKIKVFLDKYCKEEGIKEISVSSIGLIIKKEKMFYQLDGRDKIHKGYTRRKEKVERVKRSPKEKEAGYIVSDTLEVREERRKRYFYNAIDVATRFAFSMYYRELNSANMSNFYEDFKRVFPYKIRKWQNDNGHENLKEFEKKLKEEKVTQLFSYPRCPKINGYVERFNRTLREEFINNNSALIENDEEFKGLLVDYLVYYNTKRPHLSLNLKTPLQIIAQNNKMSQMYLTNTYFLLFFPKMIK